MSKYNIQADSPQEALRLFVIQFHEQEPTIEFLAGGGNENGWSWRLGLRMLVRRKKPVLRLVKKEKNDG